MKSGVGWSWGGWGRGGWVRGVGVGRLGSGGCSWFKITLKV